MFNRLARFEGHVCSFNIPSGEKSNGAYFLRSFTVLFGPPALPTASDVLMRNSFDPRLTD